MQPIKERSHSSQQATLPSQNINPAVRISVCPSKFKLPCTLEVKRTGVFQHQLNRLKMHFQSSQFLNSTTAACSVKWHIKAIRRLQSSAKFILDDASTVLTVHRDLPHIAILNISKKNSKLSTCKTQVPAAVSKLQTSGMRRRVLYQMDTNVL